MFNKILLRIIIFFIGIRFYKTTYIPKSESFIEAKFTTIDNKIIEFLFYKEIITDIKLINNNFIKKEKTFYIIKSIFFSDVPDDILKYNGVSCIFYNRYLQLYNNKDIADTLLEVYLDFIKNELKIK